MSQERYSWNEYLRDSCIDKKFEEHRRVYLNLFEEKWFDLFSNTFVDLCQVNTGNRLRPQIAFFGYLANEKVFCPTQLNYIVDIGISIELIHKSSLLIDDLIDNDKLRHNQPVFHTIYGRDKTILFSLNLLSKALIKLKDTLLLNNVKNSVFQKCIELSIQTLYDMSLGALNEVSMTKDEIFNIDSIKKVINLETATLIRNSLLLGYYSNGGCNQHIEEIFVKIGDACGYIFQVMNDLEPFCDGAKLKLHKGSINIDYENFKKNITIAFLYERMTEKERKKFISIDISDNHEINKVIYDYVQQYKVIQCFMEEIDKIEIKIILLIGEIKQSGINELWCENFKNFITLLIKVARSRLQ